MSMFIKTHFLELFLLLLVSSTIILFALYSIKWIYYWIMYLKVKSKYYDIMLTKFHDKQQSSIYNVYDNDFSLFNKKELKYLDVYLKHLNKMKIIMKGTNKVGGAFM